MNSIFCERFQKLEFIGAGGMGEIWRAYDSSTGAIVALKELHPHLVRQKDVFRFFREFEHLASVSHKNVIKIVSFNSDLKKPAYTMEYCPKGDLRVWLTKNRSQDEILSCFWQLCDGVGALHNNKNQIIHRDLKPQNILLGEDSNFKISDLGLSLSMDSSVTRVTTSNWISPGFSPPEQFKNMGTVDQTGDIYSLGAILYFMLTSQDCSDNIDLHNSAIPKDIRLILQWMLESDPKKRFRSVKPIKAAYNRVGGSAYIQICPQCGGAAISDISFESGGSITCLECKYDVWDGIE